MFVIRDQQFKQMEETKLDKVIDRTCEIITTEFPELVKTTHRELRQFVSHHIKLAASTYKIKSFDLLEDFTILSLQRPVLIHQPLPNDIERILTWPNMNESDKMSELMNLLSKKY